MIGPDRRSIRDIAFSGDTIAFMDYSFTVYRSFDAGKNWESLPNVGLGRPLLFHDGALWTATYEALRSIRHDSNVWEQRSTSNSLPLFPINLVPRGENFLLGEAGGIQLWNHSTGEIRPFTTGWNDHQIQSIVMIEDSVVVGTSYGLYITGDAKNWQRRGGPFGLGVANLVADGNILYTTTTDTVYTSSDYGMTWQSHAIDPGNPVFPGPIVPLHDNVGLVSGQTVYISDDHGKTWQDFPVPVPTILGSLAGSGDTLFTSSSNLQNQLFRSFNGGVSWQSFSLNNNKAQTYLLRYANNVLYVGTRQHGLYRSLDLGTDRSELPSLLHRGRLSNGCGSTECIW